MSWWPRKKGPGKDGEEPTEEEIEEEVAMEEEKLSAVSIGVAWGSYCHGNLSRKRSKMVSKFGGE